MLKQNDGSCFFFFCKFLFINIYSIYSYIYSIYNERQKNSFLFEVNFINE